MENWRIILEIDREPQYLQAVWRLDSIALAVATYSQEFEHLDVLINNAGIFPDEGINILTIDRNLLELAMNTNTFGVIRTTQAYLPLLGKAPAARVINVSSGLGALAGLSADSPSYCLSENRVKTPPFKAALPERLQVARMRCRSL